MVANYLVETFLEQPSLKRKLVRTLVESLATKLFPCSLSCDFVINNAIQEFSLA